MDIYVARQPIFDRLMRIYGYELLYRQSSNNYYEGINHNDATAELVHNTFLLMGFEQLTEGTKGFINFTQDLLENEMPGILPKDKVVIEILEQVEASESVVNACKNLKANGYTIALDDFIFNRTDLDYAPLIELADIIKIEFPITDKYQQRKLLKQYRNKITFLAEKVETREEYQEAVSMGYDLFQGYFFSKPIMIKSKEIGTLNMNLIDIMKELQKDHPDFFAVTETIQRDLGLSYKLLKMANSVTFGGKLEIKSLHQAVVRLGIREMKRWITIMLLRDFENTENSELIKVCLLRGKMLSLLSQEFSPVQSETDFFLAGLFSSIDVLTNESMEKVIDSLALSRDVKTALLEKKGLLYECLDCVLQYERFEFERVQSKMESMNISIGHFMDLYMMSLSWLKMTKD